ncbi:glycosyl transferase, group 1 [Methanospirillum hungatei JF-1]|jgi:glycosyltransferase involved in cell wall biosynthesis|uniref:Glycosyl transferase, group 1 n=1 Tax=Methanospirillum hungatei JF-1 (strain ATCC 27890 / DSM 864 / NBRC 100397 / JF-1) TaxID=323259 RepID=Q2FN90_METHJ|nr:glycosyltransferase family 1 protein [Methanospirillum hungatei]ABD41837.1 glycosyl transferase, group 1 [Methanospirillum hungatei JF-1]
MSSLKPIGAITGNLKQNQTGMANYAFNILQGLSANYKITQIADHTGDIIRGCQCIHPKNPPIPFNYLIWSLSASLQKKLFSQFDLIHNMCQYPVYPPKNKKYIITIFDLIPILFPELVTPVYAWQSRNLLPRVLERSDKILAISEHTKRDLIIRYQIPPDKIDVTHLGVSNHFRPYDHDLIQQYKLKKSLLNPYILFVGALEPKKNIPNLIKSFWMCLKKKPDLNLVLAGKPSWKYDEIFSLIHSLKLEKKIRVLNFIPYEELPLLYNGAEVFVFPSKYEGFGLPPLESMKCGTPVIVSNRSSLPEIVGENGLMVNPDNVLELKNLILKIIENPDYRRKLKEYYMKQAEKFTWEKCIQKTIQSYESILMK